MPVKLSDKNATKTAAATRTKSPTDTFKYDAFISHAWEDKKSVVEPLSALLTQAGCHLWLDTLELEIGDSLPRKISDGLSQSKFGIVIFSPVFLKKYWTQHELDGLLAKESSSVQKVILPVWHNLGKKEISEFSLPISMKIAGSTSDGIPELAEKLLKIIKK